MGKDKVFLHICDETFIERLVYCGKKYFDRIIIATDTEAHATEIKNVLHMESSRELSIVTDLYPEKGPLGAMVSVFEQTDVEDFAVIPVDDPNADLGLLADLYAGKFDNPDKKPVLIFCNKSGKLEPLTGVYSRNVYRGMKESLDQGMNKILRAIEGQYATVVIEEGFFNNINTPVEYKELLGN